MKSAVTIFLIISFVFVAVFGVTGMNFGQNDMHNCIAATVSGSDCPLETNSIDFVTFHLSVLKGFSKAVFDSLLLLSTFFGLAFVSIFVIRRVVWDGKFKPPLFVSATELKASMESSINKRREFYRWLAMHENSPSLIMRSI